MNRMLMLAALAALCACDPKPVAAEQVPAAAGLTDTMSCLAGDVKLSAKGEAVQIASLGMADGKLNLGLGMNSEYGGNTHFVNTSLMTVPLQAGTYHFPELDTTGMSLAEYRIKNADSETLKSYQGGIYSQHFSPIQIDPQAKLKLEIDKLSVSSSADPSVKRVYLAGRFSFNAAALPGNKTSEACISDGIDRSMKSLGSPTRIMPLFNAKLCGTEKKHVQCTFEVSVNALEYKQK